MCIPCIRSRSPLHLSRCTVHGSPNVVGVGAAVGDYHSHLPHDRTQPAGAPPHSECNPRDLTLTRRPIRRPQSPLCMEIPTVAAAPL